MFAIWTYGCSWSAKSPSDNIMHPSKVNDFNVWENSIGMRFVNVTELENVWFSMWPTRVKDYRMFVNDDNGNKGYNCFTGEQPAVLTADGWIQQGWEYNWDNPNFKQSDDHPVVCVSWEDAKAFCEWLTHKGREEGEISSNMVYRLPSDWEWSIALGLRDELQEGSPKDKDQEIRDVYPWGTTYPPPPNWGNYAGEEARNDDWPFNVYVVSGWSDDHARTSPVGAYGTRHQGLSDMSGNV